MKIRTEILVLLIAVNILLPSSVLAQSVSVNSASPAYGVASPTAARKVVAQKQGIESIKNKASREIDRRISALNNLITRINNNQKLTTDEKSSLSAQAQSEISGLISLKSRIASGTDLATLRTDVKSIINEYRVYALIMPKTGIIYSADLILSHVTSLNNIYSKLQARIQTAQQKGKDVTSLQNSLNDMKTKLDDAQKQAQAAKAAVLILEPNGYPANKTQLLSSRADLKTAREDLVAAKKDANAILQGLRAFSIDRESTPSSQSSKLSP